MHNHARSKPCAARTPRQCLRVVVGALVLITCTVADPVAAQAQTSLTGLVVGADTASPVADARILITPGERAGTTDATGRFALPTLEPGEYTIVVSKPGYADVTQRFRVVPGQPLALDVRLPVSPVVVEETTVLGRLSDYVEASASASKSSAPLIDLPQAVQILPARLLDDVGALDTKDLYRHISGVTDSPYSSTVVRGFTQREVLVNGVRGNPYGSLDGDVSGSGFSTSQFRLTNVERVEVLKGPSSALYGSGEPGGVINYVTKQPREAFDMRATFGTGSFGQALGEVDIAGPLTAGRTMRYRTAVYFEDRDSFRYNADTRNVHAVANLAWHPGVATSLSLDYEYIDQRNGAHRLRGVPVSADGTFLADIRWTATEPTDFTDLAAHVSQVRWQQVSSRGLRFEATLRATSYDRSENYHEPRGITGGGTLMQREFRDQFRANDDWTGAATISAPLSTGAVRHEVAVGADAVHQDFTFRFATARQQSAGGPVLPLSLAAPVYGTASVAGYGLTPARYATDTADTWRRGAFVQDLLTIGDRWRVMLGARIDQFDDEGGSGGIALDGDATAVTGRVGVVFKPASAMSLYGSVANGFLRPVILAQAPSANGPHDPERSRQFEAGIKGDLAGGRVQVTAAYFDTVKSNVLRPDPALGPTGTNSNAVLATGEIASRGFEFDLAGQLRPWWNLAANYSYIDTSITRDLNPALVGRPMPNAAPHKVGAFTRIDLPTGTAFGGSLESVAEREEPFAGIRAPAYTIVDLHAFQQVTPRVRVLARLENVFDREYATSSLFVARAGNIPGQPRTFSISVTVASRRAKDALWR